VGRLSLLHVNLPHLRTDRLILEPVGPVHMPFLTDLNADPEVTRHLGPRPFSVAETQAEWSRRLGDWSDISRGLGYWAGSVDGEPVGWWSAGSVAADLSVSVIGYRLTRSAWGRGLATEGAIAMVEQAFAAPTVERVLASTAHANSGSRRVLEKLGMTPGDAPSEWPVVGMVSYVLSRKDWVRSGD
jgi:RimJ/RimL family protein N-acetyltransferase